MKILIAEDNATDRKLLRLVLEAEGHECLEAADGVEALDFLKGDPVQAIISDIMMPRMDGYRFCQQVRASALLFATPFVFYTATYTSLTDERFALDLGADKFLRKPSSSAAIIDALHHAQSAQHLAPRADSIPEEFFVMREYNERLVAKLEQKNLELLLQTTAVENAANSIMITDREGGIVWVNPAFTSLTGFTPAEAIGQTPRLSKSGAHEPAFYEELWQTIRSGKTWRGEFTNRRKDGALYHCEQTITPVCAATGVITHFIGIMNDITERKQAEEDLRRTHQKLNYLQAHSPTIVYSIEPNGTDILFNSISENVEQMIGYTVQEALQPGWWAAHVHPEDRAGKRMAAILSSQDDSTDDYRFQKKDGEYIWMHAQRRVVRDAAGQPKEIIGSWTDITEKKKLEAQSMRNQRMESLGTLAGGIAHDLNNTLAPILMSLEMLRMKFTDEESVMMLDTISGSAQRGAEMVRQVLTFARGLEGKRSEIQIKHLIREVGNIIEQTFPKSIQLQTDPADDLWTVTGDATELHQVILNLCVNARDAMPKGGKLSLKAENTTLDEHFVRLHPEAKLGPYVLLRVADSGTGMPPNVMEKIFDPFFTTKPLGQGTGLGLSTVRGIIKSYAGFISVYSEVGKGTEFRVYLPAHASKLKEPVVIPRPQFPVGRGELILVVDDEASIRTIAQQTLELFGYTVLTASDGAQATALFTQHPGQIKLMLTDVAMPILDGPATIRAVRALDPGIKIIMASGLVADGHSTDTALFRSVAVLQKPYTGERLLTLIREVLDAPSV